MNKLSHIAIAMMVAAFLWPVAPQPQAQVSHLCNELLVVETNARTRLAGSTGTATVQQPDGSTVVTLQWLGYFGNTAKWFAPLSDYFTVDGVYTVTEATVDGLAIHNLPFIEYAPCKPTAVDVISFIGKSVDGYPLMTWITEQELRIVAFEMYRSDGLLVDWQLNHYPGELRGGLYQFWDHIPYMGYEPPSYTLVELYASGSSVVGTVQVPEVHFRTWLPYFPKETNGIQSSR